MNLDLRGRGGSYIHSYSGGTLPPPSLIALTSVAFALAPYALISGIGTSSSTFLSSGSSLSTKGSTSLASQTSLHMLSTTTQHFRFVWTSLSLRPRPSTGTIIANVGLSTWETKVVPINRSSADTFSLGFAFAEMSTGTMGWTSGLWMTVQHSPRQALAACLTSGFVSPH